MTKKCIAYFWESYKQTTYEEDLSNTVTFDVTPRDRGIFPELTGVDRVTVFQDDEGMVYLA